MENLLLVLVAVIIVLAWNRMSRGIDWIGDRVGETSDMLSDITLSGSKQTQRGVIISHDSLMDTAQDSVEKEANRQKQATKFKSSLKAEEIKALSEHEKFLENLMNRK